MTCPKDLTKCMQIVLASSWMKKATKSLRRAQKKAQKHSLIRPYLTRLERLWLSSRNMRKSVLSWLRSTNKSKKFSHQKRRQQRLQQPQRPQSQRKKGR